MWIAVLRRRLMLPAALALYAGLAGLIAAAVLSELGQRWWFADLFSHFRYHYALAAVLLAAVALVLGRRGAALVAVGLVASQLWAVAAPPRTETLADGSPPGRIRVMSMNVAFWNPRQDDVAAAIERAAPDIVALQEISEAWYPIVERLAHRFPHIAPANWRDGPTDNVLMSRYPIVASRVVAPPGQTWPLSHVEAAMTVNGRRMHVLVVHPPLPEDAYFTAMRQLHLDYYAAFAARTDDPVLVVGDFNITPYSPRFRAMLRAGGLRYVHLGWVWPRTWPSEIGGGYQGHVRGFPIDHILTSRHFAVKGGWTLDDVGSDHYPVVADLVLR